MRPAAWGLLAAVTLAVTWQCGTLPPPREPGDPWTVEVRSERTDPLVLYWVLANEPVGVMARLDPLEHRRVSVPVDLRGHTTLRVMVCLGRYRTRSECVYADGLVYPRVDGSILNIQQSPSRLIATVNL